MTTAAKPTFNPARGGTGRTESDLSSLSKQYSSRDLPSHTKLKYRQEGQGTSDELKAKDFKRKLEEKERSTRTKKNLLAINNNDNSKTAALKEIASSSTAKRQKTEPTSFAVLDADDTTVNDDDDDDDEEEAEDDLEMELRKVRERRKIEEEKKNVEEEKVRIENIIHGNPLLTADKGPGEFRVKRRWDDDVVFKNCARGEDIKKPRQYLNDTLRSDFHKKFMDKYTK